MIEAKKVFEQAEEKRITVDPFLKVRRALGFSEQVAQPSSKGAFNEAELSTKEVAKRVGVHKDTLLRWLRNGAIPEPKRDRKGWRKFSYAEVEAIIQFTQITLRPETNPVKHGVLTKNNWMSL